MPRLIDADAPELIERIDNNFGGVTRFAINSILAAAPTIDPESLRPHGRWVMKETMIRSPYAKNVYCSECLEETSYKHNYCPNCGAKMDLEEEQK